MTGSAPLSWSVVVGGRHRQTFPTISGAVGYAVHKLREPLTIARLWHHPTATIQGPEGARVARLRRRRPGELRAAWDGSDALAPSESAEAEAAFLVACKGLGVVVEPAWSGR